MSYLLSVVIPTKDRYTYLKQIINLIDSFDSDEIEIVIQDNTRDNSEILKFLNVNKYPHIRYAHRAEQIPVNYNSDLALLNSSGEFVCLMGDDDGVTKHIIDCVKWMKENNIDAIVPELIDYKWPGFISSSNNNVSATLSYSDFSNKIITVDPMDALYDIMDRGFVNRGNLPLVYHGIVKRTVLDQIYDIGGTFFPGPSPDIANGVALCFFVKKYVRINIPIIISGGSETHGGGIRKMKNGIANIEDIPFLPANTKNDWEKRIPKVWTGETIWPESAIKALRYMSKEDLVNKVNYEYLLSRFIVAHPVYWKQAIKLSSRKHKLFIYLFVTGIKKLKNKLVNILGINRKKNNMKTLYKINDIRQVHEHLIDVYPEFELSGFPQ